MARKYDARTTTFSPEGLFSPTTCKFEVGRLYQVEYAMEAIQHAGTVLGITCRDGVILAAEKRVTSKLLDDEIQATEKLYHINGRIVTAVAGISADAAILVQHARNDAQKHLSLYGEHIPVEQLVEKMCDMKQGYTQYGGLRPFGVSFLWAGWDDSYVLSSGRIGAPSSEVAGQQSQVTGWQLYCSDPSGNYAGWKAHCIGANSSSAQSILKQDYRDDMTLFGDGKAVVQSAAPPSSGQDAAGQPQQQKPVGSGMELVLKVLSKTMETTTITSDKLEIAVLRSHTDKNGAKEVVTKIYQGKEVDTILKHYGYVVKSDQAASSSAMQH